LLASYAWYVANSGYTTHPVGQRRHNPWGLDDMHGNVWEWCQDFRDGYPGGIVTDPQGPGTGWSRVLRGGGYNFGPWNCRSASRNSDNPVVTHYKPGFRVVLAPSQP